jgi:nucleoside-diphosphate-sugar epimerase
MIGLGRMGANVTHRLLRRGHTAVVFDRTPGAVDHLAEDGARGAKSMREKESAQAALCERFASRGEAATTPTGYCRRCVRRLEVTERSHD